MIKAPLPKEISAAPYAKCVPVLVILAQSALRAQYGYESTLAAAVLAFHPEFTVMLFLAAVVVAAISYAVIYPFRNRAFTRWVAVTLCVLCFVAFLEWQIPVITR